MAAMTTAERRGYQQICGDDGAMMVIACDQRGGMRTLLAADPALDVPSPSFTLVQTYETRVGPVHHYDLWRLDGPADLMELGWDEACNDVVLVEWPDRLADLAHPRHILLPIPPPHHPRPPLSPPRTTSLPYTTRLR